MSCGNLLVYCSGDIWKNFHMQVVAVALFLLTSLSPQSILTRICIFCYLSSWVSTCSYAAKLTFLEKLWHLQIYIRNAHKKPHFGLQPWRIFPKNFFNVISNKACSLLTLSNHLCFKSLNRFSFGCRIKSKLSTTISLSLTLASFVPGFILFSRSPRSSYTGLLCFFSIPNSSVL